MKTRCDLCGGRKTADSPYCGPICARLAANGRTGGWSREHLFPPDEERAICDAYRRGSSTPTLAVQHGTNPETIRTILLRGKVRLRTRAESKRLTVQARKAFLAVLERQRVARRARKRQAVRTVQRSVPVAVPILTPQQPVSAVPVLVCVQPVPRFPSAPAGVCLGCNVPLHGEERVCISCEVAGL